MTPHVSVVIPTRNRAASLARTLESLARQSADPASFEVLVVDNGSSDDTSAVASSFSSRLPGLRVVGEPRAALHLARHAGLRESRAPVLAYVDDDIEADPLWVESIAGAFANHDAWLCGGPDLPAFEGIPPAWVARRWEGAKAGSRALPLLSLLDLGGGARWISPYYVFGCNFAIRRDVLTAAAGFHPDGVPREWRLFRGDGETWLGEYLLARGRRAWYEPRARITHHVPASRLTLEYAGERAFDQGVSDSFTLLRSRLRRGRCGVGRCGSIPHARRMGGLRLFVLLKRLFAGAGRGRDAAGLEMHRASLRGFAAHRRAVRENGALRRWVMRDDFLDAAPG